MLGRSSWHLEAGDVFKPVEYELTPLIVAEYAHGVEEDNEFCISSVSPWGRQVRPPTMVHVDKMRLLEANCPEGHGPHHRIHYEYHARHHSPAFVGERLVVSGRVTDKYIKRGRLYIDLYVEVRTSDGRLVTTYTDKTLLQYTPIEENAND